LPPTLRAAHEVAAGVPLAPEGLLGLRGVLPVAQGPGVAPHPEAADVAVGDVAALGVAHRQPEAGHDPAEAPGPHRPGLVGDEHVPHLRRPQPVVELDAERVLPAGVQGRREGLASRGGEAQAGEIG
jgi:hypothetical protein